MATPTNASPRRQFAFKAMTDFFSMLGLPQDAADALAQSSRLHRCARGTTLSLEGGAYFLIDGRMSEVIRPDKIRLWREVMLFADTDELPFHGIYSDDGPALSSDRSNNSFGTCLSRCVLIQVVGPRLGHLAMAEPSIALMLSRIVTKRYSLTERLYAATRASPIARVATVLDYLTEPTRRKVIKVEEDGTRVMATAEELIASGPSQTDIADALCLGRTTVEKAFAELRQIGALKAFGPGERTNRCYPVEDRALLKQIARRG